MVKKQFEEYYLGLDIGTDSVGWAVTDPQYNILSFNRKAMWGIHLFEEGDTAEVRRASRINRRRLQRRNQRLALLRELMGPEIATVDPGFFQRLEESFKHQNDRDIPQPNSIFNDPTFKDKDYHKKYPTIYHLRNDLKHTDEKPDIRLVYLAIHHILKNRGHFLFEGLSDSSGIPDFDSLFFKLLESASSELDIQFSAESTISEIKRILTSRNMNVTERKSSMGKVLSAESKAQKAFVNLLSGATVKFDDLLSETGSVLDDDIDAAYTKVNFKESIWEENHEDFEEVLGSEVTYTVDLAKQIYDWGLLSGILQGHESISDAMVALYKQHQTDLFLLKSILKNYAGTHKTTTGEDDYSLYKAIFKSSEPENYCNYSGHAYNIKNQGELKSVTQEVFCKYLSKKLKDVDFNTCPEYEDMKKRIELGTFMPKLRTKDNILFPNALHKAELCSILDNISKYYPFLTETDEDGITVRDKILQLCTFRIPYYVGPLGEFSSTGWAVRKEKGRILPWNFEKKIDIEKSAELFVDRLVSTCSILTGEQVLPKCSPLYCRFKLYNEINSITVNGQRISRDLKKQLISEFYEKMNVAKLTKKHIAAFIKSRTGADAEIGGIDEIVQSNLHAEHKLSDILGDLKKCRQLSENVARIITIFGDDPKMLKRKLKMEFGNKITDDQLSKLSKIKFSDWGNLSSKLLTEIYHTFEDGSDKNIITAMSEYSLNLMELLSNKYTYIEQINRMNTEISGTSSSITYDDVRDLYCSPAVKHAIWRTLGIIKEIVKITGHNPKKVFIETTRQEGEKVRKLSRKHTLVDKYRDTIKAGGPYTELLSSLEGQDESALRSKKLYAYYLQLGRCAYCGKHIDLNDLANSNIYDMDHIYPQSKKTDDSVNNNMVLVCKTHNVDKSNHYPIEPDIQTKMDPFWRQLKDAGLMSSEKYNRLIRTTPFTDEELSGFIARQLVETSQTVKAVAKILEKVFGPHSDIVYVKGENVSRFRHTYSTLEEGKPDKAWYVKSRNVNDLHHAKDAYLNIVVGNVYDTKFTKNPLNFVKSGAEYSLNKVFDFKVERDGIIAWLPGDGGTIAVVDMYMRRNNILFTRAPYKETGRLFDLQLMKKTEGQHPFKQGMDCNRYGAYNNVKGSYYALVEYAVKGKRVRGLEYVPIISSARCKDKDSLLRDFQERGYTDPVILIPCIRIDSMFEINGKRMYIRSRTGDNIIFILAEQLILPYEQYRYCKKIFNYEKALADNKIVMPSVFEINATDNKKLYNVLIEKLENTYSGISAIHNVAVSVKKLETPFEAMDLVDQTSVIQNLLKVLQCKPVYADFKKLGGAGLSGRIQYSKKIGPSMEMVLINQSITGLFESRLKLEGL